jgi:uncharacterized protein
MGISALLKNPQLHDDLAVFGDSEDFQQGLAHLSYSHGLMTAVIIGPEFIPSSEWLPLIVDLSTPESDVDLRLTAAELVLLEYGKILESLKEHDKVYEPFFFEDSNQRVVTKDWLEGFLAGIGLRNDAWAPLLDGSDPYVRTLLYILFQDDKFYAKLAESKLDLDEILAGIHHETSDFVQTLYHRWGAGRLTDVQTPSRRAHKAGRNDPCPCGSGQKYKKCCLN